MNYAPRPGSLPHRVCSYFQRQPDEELSREDIALKFDATSAAQVDGQLLTAVTAQLLTRSKRARGNVVYLAGSALAATTLRNDGAAAPGPAPRENGAALALDAIFSNARHQPAAQLPPIDVAAIGVGSTEPVPSTQKRRRSPWPALFERLAAPGQHSDPIPTAYRKQLQSAVTVWCKGRDAKFAVRAVGDAHFRIWRVS